MPIYEYKCKECENEFEDFMQINSENPKCPECESDTERMMSRFCGIVKGSDNRSLDCVIGEDADKKRDILRKRKEKRLAK